MLKVVLIMLSGVAVGYLMRGKNLKFVSKIIMCAIFLLLFFLGVSVGGNSDIMDNLATIGLDGLIISVVSLSGSCLGALIVYNKFFKQVNNEG
ncbi:MAG: LysO family transporter [Rikenellaceae bacterium]